MAASKLAARKDQFGKVTLTDADLPGTSWRFPGNASCSFDEESRLTSVELIWGGAPISHHGIVISDGPVPFHGSGMHFTPLVEDCGRIIALYPTDQVTGYGPGEFRGAIRVDGER